MFDLRQKKIDEIGALLIKNRVVLTDYVIKKTHGNLNEVEDLGQMNALLLQKVEELTLYIIDLQKQIEVLKTTKQ